MAAIEAGADAVTILGALGGARIDHALANVGLLAHPALAGRPAWLYDEQASRISLLVAPDEVGAPAPLDLPGRVGDLVSLLPLGESAPVVTTTACATRCPRAADLGPAARPINVRTEFVGYDLGPEGRLLVIETPATIRP